MARHRAPAPSPAAPDSPLPSRGDPGGSADLLHACGGILASVAAAEAEIRRIGDTWLPFPRRSRVVRAALASAGWEGILRPLGARPSLAPARVPVPQVGSALSLQDVHDVVSHRIQMALAQAAQERSAELRDTVEQSVRSAAASQEGRLLHVLTQNLTQSLRTLEGQLEDRMRGSGVAPVEFADEDLEEIRHDDRATSEAGSGSVDLDAPPSPAGNSGSVELDSLSEYPVQGADGSTGANLDDLAAAEAEVEALVAQAAGELGAVDQRLAAGGNADLLDAIEDVRTIDVPLAADFSLEGFADVVKADPALDEEESEEVSAAAAEEGVIADEDMMEPGARNGDGFEEPANAGGVGDPSAGSPEGGSAGGDASWDLEAEAPPRYADADDDAIVVDLNAGGMSLEGEAELLAIDESPGAGPIDLMDPDLAAEPSVGAGDLDLSDVPPAALRTMDSPTDGRDGVGDDHSAIVDVTDEEEEEGEAVALPPDEGHAPSPEELEAVNRYLELAADLRSRKSYQAAQEVYTKVLDIDPRSFDAYVGRGVLYLETGDLVRAAQEFRASQTLDPDAPEAYMGLGEVYFVRKQYPRAIKCFSRTLALDPELADAHYKRGLSYYHEGNFKKAFLDLKRAYELDPELPHIQKYLKMMVRQLRPPA